MVKLFFCGKDKRSEALKKLYEGNVEFAEDIKDADFVIFPIPFTKDQEHVNTEDILINDIIPKLSGKTIFSGGVPEAIKEKFEQNNVKYIDLMSYDEVALLNAIPTAEGAIAKAMELTDKTIHGSNILVLGFGRVGKILADKLKGLNAKVFCEARNKKDLAHIKALGYNEVELKYLDNFLSNIDIIFSTVPTLILDKERIKLLSRDTVVIDLASKPGSVDFDAAKRQGVKAVLELGLPSIVAPMSAAEYLKETIDNIINK